uniref:efflux RND transporter permease subunit n=1 Tax=Caballeronia sp. LjRoot34 TaxID=3342325 RepID=UPI003F4FB7A0
MAVGKPDSLTGTFQGTAQAFQASLKNEPCLIAAALVVVYLILGILYESAIHPLTIISTLPSAGVGALHRADVMRPGSVDHGHDPADRDREEERDHDDRLRAGC